MTVRFIFALALWLALTVSPSLADDFRVETDVFDDKAPQPVAETLTLFASGVVYDFVLSEPKSTTVFDVRRGRIILLDPESKTKAELTTDWLLQFSAGIRARTVTDAAKPLFGTEFSAHVDDKKILLQGSNLVYEATGSEPKVDSAVPRFREFADWFARLNAARPGNPPPFGRLELNRQLAVNAMVPVEISRTLTLPGRFRDAKLKATSRHAFTWMLSTSDRNRIEVAGTEMAKYELVTLKAFWERTEVAQNRPAAAAR